VIFSREPAEPIPVPMEVDKNSIGFRLFSALSALRTKNDAPDEDIIVPL